MNTVPKPQSPKRQGQRAWTDAQRAEQAAKLRARKIWLNSTGPRTEQGKSISRLNALKHGQSSRPVKNFMAQFRQYRAWLRLCWAQRAKLAQIQKNELIDLKQKAREKRPSHKTIRPKNHQTITVTCKISDLNGAYQLGKPPQEC